MTAFYFLLKLWLVLCNCDLMKVRNYFFCFARNLYCFDISLSPAPLLFGDPKCSIALLGLEVGYGAGSSQKRKLVKFQNKIIKILHFTLSITL
jgi:hypothetical protein